MEGQLNYTTAQINQGLDRIVNADNQPTAGSEKAVKSSVLKDLFDATAETIATIDQKVDDLNVAENEDGSVMLGSFTLRRDGDDLFVDVVIDGVVKTRSLGTAT